MSRKNLTFALLFFLQVLSAATPEPESSQVYSRFAFGSCARQTAPQPVWKGVKFRDPQLFMFIGDNVYADTRDAKVMKAAYAQWKKVPQLDLLMHSVPFVAIWDDHDYGENDAGGDFPFKETSKQIFLDFFKAKENDVRWKRPGLYAAYMFGPPEKRVQVILLDTRYFRSPLKSAGERGRYLPDSDPSKTMLGAEQWAWLEQQLREPAAVRLIVSSIQVVAEDHPFEKWANFPLERKKLFDLVRTTGAKGVVFLSGDRHFAELSVEKAAGNYPLYDLTSSSLNAPIGRHREKNRHRVGEMVTAANFGMVEIDWTDKGPIVSLAICSEAGGTVLQRKIKA